MLNFWKQFIDSRWGKSIQDAPNQKETQKQRQLQEEEADGHWGLFTFAYNQWLSKATIMIMKKNESQDSQIQIEDGKIPEDMTDQVRKTHTRHIVVRHMRL